ncbi:MAG: hypothetical protein GXX95_00260 [Methanomassiliicoccus sp.]|nr:hypothetical protein [Methanomassiliicoccus sp.]
MAVLMVTSALTTLPANNPSAMKLDDENSNASVDMATSDLGHLLSYNKIATSITLVQENVVAQLNSNVHINGQLSGIAWNQDTVVRLHVLCPDGSIDVPAQGKFANTDPTGGFTVDYIPTTVGNYTILAIFAGTNRYSQASGNTQFEVHEEQLVTVVKAPTSMALELTSSSVKVGDVMEIAGTLIGNTDQGNTLIAGAQIGAVVVRPDGSTVSPVQGPQVLTDAQGSFIVTFSPANTGTYQFQFDFAGDGSFEGTRAAISSEVAAPVIVKSATSISLTLASSSVKTGMVMHADGVLTGSGPIAGATLTLQVQLPSGSVVNPTTGMTTVTDADGEFVIDYTPSSLGTYVFIATFAGDSMNNGSSVSVTFTATAPSTTTVPYYYLVSQNGVVKNAAGSTVYPSSGTATATAAIQWAIDNCPTGKTVKLDAGSFPISAKIYVYKNLIGSGVDKTKLYASQNFGGITMIQMSTKSGAAINHITLSDMELDGKGLSWPTGTFGAVEPIRATYCTIENMYIHHFPKSHGVNFQASSYNIVRNCTISYIGNLAKSTTNGSYGNGVCAGNMFPDVGSDHNLVENCDISYCSMVGINWEPGNYNVVRNCYVHDLTSWYTNGVKQLTCAAYMWPKGAVASVGNEYYDSTFEAMDYGFSINGGQTTIDGCTIIGKGKSTIGIYMHKADGCKITDNVIRPTGTGRAIYVAGCLSATITGNTITSGDSAHSGYGIWVGTWDVSPLTGIVISGNTVNHCGTGIAVTADVKNGVITNNVCYSCTTGITNSGTGTTLSGNRVS